MAINTGRVIGGGLAAGLVMNLIDGPVNGVLLAAQWNAETNALNPGLMAKAGTGSMVGWIITDFIVGIMLVWVYAAIRPRFGPGPRTAMLASLATWFVGHAFFASYTFMGLYSSTLIGLVSLGGLVSALAGGWVGAKLYQE
ncbi:MAG: hypothetical protein ACHQXA_07695 [Gemmatimonadales bacterium]